MAGAGYAWIHSDTCAQITLYAYKEKWGNNTNILRYRASVGASNSDKYVHLVNVITSVSDNIIKNGRHVRNCTI